MSTYAESKGKAPIDWNARLNTPVKKITEQDAITWAKQASGSWVTCACGSQCADIPRDDIGAPIDLRLERHGKVFGRLIEAVYDAVCGRFSHAAIKQRIGEAKKNSQKSNTVAPR